MAMVSEVFGSCVGEMNVSVEVENIKVTGFAVGGIVPGLMLED